MLGQGRINDYNALTTLIEPKLVISSYYADDDNMDYSQGNGDGMLNPGETVEFYPTVSNKGLKDVNNCVLSVAGDENLQFFSNTLYLGYIKKGGSVTLPTPLIFRVKPDVPDGTVVSLYLHYTYYLGGPFDDTYKIIVHKDSGTTDTVALTGQPLLSGDLAKGMNYVPALKFTIQADTNYATLDKLTIHQTGTAAPDAFGQLQALARPQRRWRVPAELRYPGGVSRLYRPKLSGDFR